jgi:hypothetical protein
LGLILITFELISVDVSMSLMDLNRFVLFWENCINVC